MHFLVVRRLLRLFSFDMTTSSVVITNLQIGLILSKKANGLTAADGDESSWMVAPAACPHSLAHWLTVSVSCDCMHSLTSRNSVMSFIPCWQQAGRLLFFFFVQVAKDGALFKRHLLVSSLFYVSHNWTLCASCLMSTPLNANTVLLSTTNQWCSIKRFKYRRLSLNRRISFSFMSLFRYHKGGGALA